MIEASGASDPGCVRANNEDYYLVEPSLGLYLVADGMGGAQAGGCASRLAVETVRDIIRNSPVIRNNSEIRNNPGTRNDPGIQSNPDGAIPDELVDAFIEANRRLMQAAEA